VNWPRRHRSNTMTSEANTEDDLEVDPGSNLKMAEDSGLEADSITDQDRDQDEHEQAKIEAWLDEHPEFFQEYLIRKGTRCMVDSWLVAHALPPGITTTLHNVEETDESADDDVNTSTGTWSNDSCGNQKTQQLTAEQQQQQQEVNNGAGQPAALTPSQQAVAAASNRSISGSGSKNSSGSGTPVRKISAHEFERGGLTKPLVTTVDGSPTFLSPNPPTNGDGVDSRGHALIRKRSRHDIKGLNETDLILELVKDICNDLDIKNLCHKILQNVGIITNADRCSLFIVQGEVGSESHCLVSDLFDVNVDSTVAEMSKKTEIRIPWGSGIVGMVAASGKSVNISDCYAEEKFNPEVDIKTGYKTRSMMCHPILDSHGEVIAVAQVINKGGQGPDAQVFGKEDESVVEKYLPFCGIGLKNAQLYERSQLEVKRNQVLLDLAGVIFQEQSTIDNMIHRILTHMLSLIRCERAMLLLVHQGSQGTFSRVFDLETLEIDLENGKGNDDFSTRDGRFPVNAGITGFVAATKQTVNIPDAYSDKKFDPSVDGDPSVEGEQKFKHRTILCMPIMYSNKPNKVLGVFQLVNKFDNLPFTKNDENFVEAFAIFCGMGIHNVHMYEKTVLAMAKQQVTLEVLSYHATAALEEAQKLARQKIPSAAALQLHSFTFDDFGLENDEMLQAALRMFIDLDFLGRFHIDYLTLCRFLSSIKKNYRDVTYHNWRHAFNVAQMMFATITATQWWKKLGEIECLALIVACLCHDLDHRGTNNSFQVKADSNIAQLYSTSTMEHHHFDQCVMIMNSKGNRILDNMSQDDYKRVIVCIEDAILATDLAVYFRRRQDTFDLIESNAVDFFNDHHRSLARGLLMTACDLGAITKPWPTQKRVALLVADEFFYQGDLEKTQLKVDPIDMMNREKKDKLPTMQVGFIDNICSPVYKAFASMSDRLEPMLAGCNKNREKWTELAKKGPSAWELLTEDEDDDDDELFEDSRS